jgi:hypothetical protein
MPSSGYDIGRQVHSLHKHARIARVRLRFSLADCDLVVTGDLRAYFKEGQGVVFEMRVYGGI